MTSYPDLTDQLVRLRPHTDGVVVADVAGELDFAVTPAVRRRLIEASGPHTAVLIVTLDGVELLSAAAISMLVEVARLAYQRGTEVRFVATSRIVLRPLAITGDDARLALFPSQVAALGA